MSNETKDVHPHLVGRRPVESNQGVTNYINDQFKSNRNHVYHGCKRKRQAMELAARKLKPDTSLSSLVSSNHFRGLRYQLFCHSYILRFLFIEVPTLESFHFDFSRTTIVSLFLVGHCQQMNGLNEVDWLRAVLISDWSILITWL